MPYINIGFQKTQLPTPKGYIDPMEKVRDLEADERSANLLKMAGAITGAVVKGKVNEHMQVEQAQFKGAVSQIENQMKSMDSTQLSQIADGDFASIGQFMGDLSPLNTRKLESMLPTYAQSVKTGRTQAISMELRDRAEKKQVEQFWANNPDSLESFKENILSGAEPESFEDMVPKGMDRDRFLSASLDFLTEGEKALEARRPSAQANFFASLKAEQLRSATPKMFEEHLVGKGFTKQEARNMANQVPLNAFNVDRNAAYNGRVKNQANTKLGIAYANSESLRVKAFSAPNLEEAMKVMDGAVGIWDNLVNELIEAGAPQDVIRQAKDTRDNHAKNVIPESRTAVKRSFSKDEASRRAFVEIQNGEYDEFLSGVGLKEGLQAAMESDSLRGTPAKDRGDIERQLARRFDELQRQDFERKTNEEEQKAEEALQAYIQTLSDPTSTEVAIVEDVEEVGALFAPSTFDQVSAVAQDYMGVIGKRMADGFKTYAENLDPEDFASEDYFIKLNNTLSILDPENQNELVLALDGVAQKKVKQLTDRVISFNMNQDPRQSLAYLSSIVANPDVPKSLRDDAQEAVNILTAVDNALSTGTFGKNANDHLMGPNGMFNMDMIVDRMANLYGQYGQEGLDRFITPESAQFLVQSPEFMDRYVQNMLRKSDKIARKSGTLTDKEQGLLHLYNRIDTAVQNMKYTPVFSKESNGSVYKNIRLYLGTSLRLQSGSIAPGQDSLVNERLVKSVTGFSEDLETADVLDALQEANEKATIATATPEALARAMTSLLKEEAAERLPEGIAGKESVEATILNSLTESFKRFYDYGASAGEIEAFSLEMQQVLIGPATTAQGQDALRTLESNGFNGSLESAFKQTLRNEMFTYSDVEEGSYQIQQTEIREIDGKKYFVFGFTFTDKEGQTVHLTVPKNAPDNYFLERGVSELGDRSVAPDQASDQAPKSTNTYAPLNAGIRTDIQNQLNVGPILKDLGYTDLQQDMLRTFINDNGRQIYNMSVIDTDGNPEFEQLGYGPDTFHEFWDAVPGQNRGSAFMYRYKNMGNLENDTLQGAFWNSFSESKTGVTYKELNALANSVLQRAEVVSVAEINNELDVAGQSGFAAGATLGGVISGSMSGGTLSVPGIAGGGALGVAMTSSAYNAYLNATNQGVGGKAHHENSGITSYDLTFALLVQRQLGSQEKTINAEERVLLSNARKIINEVLRSNQ